MVQYEIKITGRVQGVGFRYFVQKRANDFNIKGWVKNTRDGSVVVMAQGDFNDMETFMDHLRLGPSMARVLKVEKSQMPELEDFSDFSIRY
ncbi:acylphosphatase [Mariniphaga sp.]|uniref:acylphosphatase n=1 Tax=Mariniphaga sp. TaxID=1954475 RepID=UPI003567648A